MDSGWSIHPEDTRPKRPRANSLAGACSGLVTSILDLLVATLSY